MPTYQKEANAVLQRFLRKLFLQEDKEFLLLANNWKTVSNELEKLIEKLAEQEFKTPTQLYKLLMYEKFLEESKVQIAQYTKVAGGVIADSQKTFGTAGLKSAQEMIALRVEFFQKLPVEAINNFIGKSFYNGSLLDETLFANSYPDYIARVKDELLKGVALGRSPRLTAKLISQESTAPLWQSLRLARTEQINIFRETSKMQMEKSGVVDGLQRIEQGDACDYCKSVDRQIYKFGEEQDDFHPNCRGTYIPYFND